MLRSLKTTQRGVRMIPVAIDGSAVNGGTLTTNGVVIGDQHVKVTETGAGRYTITLNTPGTMPCGAVVCPSTDLSICYFVSSTKSTVVIAQNTATTGAALADADFTVLIFAVDAEDET